MSTLSDALRGLAAKCRFSSSDIIELGAAKELSLVASDLE
jgi:hypothetical protein